jgi:hypothetical protein
MSPAATTSDRRKEDDRVAVAVRRRKMEQLNGLAVERQILLGVANVDVGQAPTGVGDG